MTKTLSRFGTLLGIGCIAFGVASAAFPQVAGPMGLPEQKRPASPQMVEMGRRIFFDARLSADGKVSCAFCHQPSKAFTDGRATSLGAYGQVSSRNTPSLLNVSLSKVLFWDGRGAALSEHAIDALFNPVEHGLKDFEQVKQTISSDDSLAKLFFSAFRKAPETAWASDIRQAVAAYLETLRSGNSPFDLYFYGKKAGAMPASAARGLELFRGRGGCSSCHTIETSWALFSDQGFHSLGIGRERFERQLPALVSRLQSIDPDRLGHYVLAEPDLAALGRFAVSRKPQDLGKFRTPSLRNVALTAPYMHDGSVATLEEAIDLELYYRSFSGRPILLSPDEKQDLAEFLRALTSYKP
jgi:cytochrome c peroxidase